MEIRELDASDAEESSECFPQSRAFWEQRLIDDARDQSTKADAAWGLVQTYRSSKNQVAAIRYKGDSYIVEIRPDEWVLMHP